MVTVFGILNLTEDSFFDESRRLAVTAPRHGFPAAGGIVRCAGEVTVWIIITVAGDIAVRGGFLNQT